MPIRLKTCRAIFVCLAALLPGGVRAEGIDTEHLFGFMIGTDVGNVGEREFQTQTTGRFARNGGNYRAIGQELELEFVPLKNFRVEMGTRFCFPLHPRRSRSGGSAPSCPGRAFPSTCATGFSIGTRLRLASPSR